MSSLERIFYVLIFLAVQLVIGTDGASQKRRLILLLSVGWVPPDLRPSGACSSLGARVSCGLFTPSRVTPYRGCASAEARGKPTGLGAIAITTGVACVPRVVRDDRIAIAARELSNECSGWLGVGVPGAFGGADWRWRGAIRPGAFNKLPTALGIADFGDGTLPVSLATGISGGDRA
jgi:hypothetical protein